MKSLFYGASNKGFCKGIFANSLYIPYVSLKLTATGWTYFWSQWIDRYDIFTFLWEAILKYNIFLRTLSC